MKSSGPTRLMPSSSYEDLLELEISVTLSVFLKESKICTFLFDNWFIVATATYAGLYVMRAAV